MDRIFIGSGIDCHAFNSQFLAGPDYPNGNFTSICNKNFFKHNKLNYRENYLLTLISANTWSYSTASSFCTSISITAPLCSEFILFINFMASIMQIVSPFFTRSPTFKKGGAPGPVSYTHLTLPTIYSV